MGVRPKSGHGTVALRLHTSATMPGPGRRACALIVALAALGGVVRPARATTFTVTTNADDGAGSLRQAIVDANADAVADTIAFAIPTGGVPRITLLSPLPTIAQPLTVDGTTQLPAGWVELGGEGTLFAAGLTLASTGCTVRGLVLDGFSGSGIEIQAPGGDVVEGNRIGTDPSGTVALSTLAYGIEVANAPGNRIGGTAVGAGNLVSGNLFGIFVHGAGATGNVIEGNLIGVAASGTSALANGATGIWISGASGTVVGGTDPGAGNVIAGNAGDGIDVTGAGAVDTVIAGNAIGFAADLGSAVGNGGDGIYVSSGASRTSIGVTAPNWIGHSSIAGVRLDPSAGTRNELRGNVITANATLGIDIGASGVTANDAGDGDTGANDLQNFPILDAGFAGGTSVDGVLDSTPDTVFTIEVFAVAACDPSGNGEGDEFVGTTVAGTDGGGHAAFTVPLSRLVDASIDHLSATATDDLGNTSEFSPCTPVTLLPTTTTTTTTTSTTAAPASTTTSTTDASTTSTSDLAATTTTSTTAAPASTTTSTTVASTTSTTDPATTTTSTTGAPASTTTSTTVASTTSTTDPGPTTTTSTTAPGATTTTSTTAGPASTTTSTTVASTTSSTDPAGTSTTSTTGPGATTTTTTLPGSCTDTSCGCAVGASYDSIACRLDAFAATVAATTEMTAAVRDRVGRQLTGSRLRVRSSRTMCAAAKRGPARRQLRSVARRLARVARALGPGRAASSMLARTATVLRDDTRTLRRTLACP